MRFCMADELNGQALPVHLTNPDKNYNFQNDGTSRYFGLTLKIGALSKLGSFFPVVVLFMCLIKLNRAAVL